MSFAHKQRHRADNNQGELVKLFMQLGGLWVPGANKPFDGWAYHARFGYLPVEIKNPNRQGTRNEYTPAQRKIIQILTIANAPWLVWRTQDDVIRSVNDV